MTDVTHWYLSFAGADGFLGAVIIEAPGANAAVHRAKALGCAPSEDIAIVPVPPETIPDPEFCNRLLTRGEIEQLGAGPLVGPMTADETEAVWRDRVTRGGEIR